MLPKTCSYPPFAAMIYIFAWASHFKLGYAACPWRRLASGFWHDLHPLALCGLLGDPELLYAFEGEQELEMAMHGVLGPAIGEFYDRARLEDTVSFLRLVLEPMPLPERPMLYIWPRRLRPCCGGDNGGYQRDDHMRRARATKGKTRPCERCGKKISVRVDHWKSHAKRCVRSVRVD